MSRGRGHDDDREGVIAAAVVEVAGRNSQLAVGAEGNQVAVAFPHQDASARLALRRGLERPGRLDLTIGFA
jgi:hypothetical protein